MSGIELRDDVLIVEREPNALDELAIPFSALLSESGVEHVFVAGYVAILTGRPRATDDVDVIVEELDQTETERLVETLESNDYWGPAMPLGEAYRTLSAGTSLWVAPNEQLTPHLEVKFPTDEFDHASLSNAIDARIADATVPVGPLELQIAYKLFLGGQKDLEDAAHLYALLGESLRRGELEQWVEELDVSDRYARLTDL